MDIDEGRQVSTRELPSHRRGGRLVASIDNWDANLVAAAAAVAGVLSALPQLPSPVSALLLAAFVFFGPGSLLTRFLPDVSALTRRSLIPVFGLSVMIVAAAAATMIGFYAPRIMLLVVSGAVFVVAAFDARRTMSKRPV